MKAVIFQSKDQPLEIKEVETPSPLEGEVLIRLSYASLNHLDLWIWKEQSLETPVISGSDGSGIVSAVGEGVDSSLIGKEVIINPSLYWGANEKMFSEDYQILGNPSNGTFAEFIVIPREYVYEKPAHLSMKEAAAIPMAALTAYRALFTKGQTTEQDKVLITGIGGGAALYLMQMAVATGATVYVTSSSDEKIKRAIELGAKGGFNYKQQDWVNKAKQQAGGFDVIIDSAGGNGFAALTEAANAAARIVLFGRTAGNINNLKPGIIYNKQLQIMGTVMGSSKEFAEMIKFYRKYKLRPVIDKEFSLHQVNEAFKYMDEGSHFGKVVFRIS
jgi:zinc-binding alcohol dehydrogenase/oxidoreductase